MTTTVASANGANSTDAYRSGTSHANMLANTGGSAGSPSVSADRGYIEWGKSGATYWCDQLFLEFDTSFVGTDDISSVLLELNGLSGPAGTAFQIDVSAFDYGASITSADLRSSAQLAALELLATIDSTGWVTDAYNAFTSQAGFPAAINKTGVTRLVVYSHNYRLGTDPTTDDYVQAITNQAGSDTRDAKLTIVHAPGAPPPEDAGSVALRTLRTLRTLRSIR